MSLPLSGHLVIEFAGLAPGPYTGHLLQTYGAHVLRIDPHTTTTTTAQTPTTDTLSAHKRSLKLNLKSPSGHALLLRLLRRASILIDPYRPGVLEKLNLSPRTVHAINPKLVYARLTGFRRDGEYAGMAGHDINYLAVSGALSLLGRAGERPAAPGNILGDFAGGGLVCFCGILLALLRGDGEEGRVVEANMVDGTAGLTSFARFEMAKGRGGAWGNPRGENLLDGGVPFYDTYPTKDGKYVAVGALEERFYKAFVEGLFTGTGLHGRVPDRRVPGNLPVLRELFGKRFLEKTREEWERIFDGTDACVTPVLGHAELRERGFEQRPIVTLKGAEVEGSGWTGKTLKPGEGGKEALSEWWGLKEGVEWRVNDQDVFEDVGEKAKL
ncbi:CoA-transferase family III [Choiromyces venosus 120613-1]|uniref:CoA-transferase family III n=1 Tax=Choiromyces venosus 120613-1 TaxID=1336337 RepID=A0A3N4K1P8_9PEZI|nr:CoA-transferase family III [Choiromyces venosus 120613-1]